MDKCPYCRIRMKIVHLRQYLPDQDAEGWIFWCMRCQRYFAAPTDEQIKKYIPRSSPAALWN